MPICISPNLPAFHILSEENIFVMDSDMPRTRTSVPCAYWC